jgi:superfamily II DNA or RNA helicase
MSTDFSVAGLKVRVADNPGRQGTTTGRVKTTGSFQVVEIEFGPNQRQYKPAELLEFIPDQENLDDIFATGALGGIRDLRKILISEKLRGDYTNVFYSMGIGNTIFYPHQFKPVLQFVESTDGRILIADEVGLGKTIEAIYIWKELQARNDARRLLIVCPAVLRNKWKGDLRSRFGMDSRIVKAADLLEELSWAKTRDTKRPFCLISSLEGIRIREDSVDPDSLKARDRLAVLLQETSSSAEPLLDLVIVDEAHYLRNPGTANNQVVKMLRDASQHLVLLSATPIQTSSENLYNLLRIINPEQFFDSQLFSSILESNRPIIGAISALLATPARLAEAAELATKATQDPQFSDDNSLMSIASELNVKKTLSSEAQVEYARLLEQRSIFAQYLVRTRKRDVFQDRVIREAMSRNIEFNPIEQRIYDSITKFIRGKSTNAPIEVVFALIMRQRQMASCLPAAISAWIEDDEDNVDDFDQIYDDLGEIEIKDEKKKKAFRIPKEILEEIPLAQLIEVDPKYHELVTVIGELLSHDPSEKVLIFAYFRRTLTYLLDRLTGDGFEACVIMGGMGEDKYDVIERFATRDGPNILLSSEVGSEGIDLQFCRIVVNYDLPWNPMKVEQRIGRIDRIGQKAEKISIINLFREGSIEERILMRLYLRINIFRESIGDLEPILGGVAERLLVDILDPNLTDAEREERALQTELTIVLNRSAQNDLEEKAMNLFGFSDYILRSIEESRDQKRWIDWKDMLFIVNDFFSTEYPGTYLKVVPKSDRSRDILLSNDAKDSLREFVFDQKPQISTRLHLVSKPIHCYFGNSGDVDQLPSSSEVIETKHPLIQWVQSHYESGKTFHHPGAAIRLPRSKHGCLSGTYVFVCHEWSAEGLKTRKILKYSSIHLDSGHHLESNKTELLVNESLEYGDNWEGWRTAVQLDRLKENYGICDHTLRSQWDSFARRFQEENLVQCNQQERQVRLVADRKINDLTERISAFRASDDPKRTRLIPALTGQLNNVKSELHAQIDRIEKRRKVDVSYQETAAGLLRVG